MPELDTLLFWGSLSFALAVAFVLTVPVNRWLLARGKGHTAVHETGIHGGPPTKVVGAAVIVAFVFGTTVVVAEGISNEDTGHGTGGHGADDRHRARQQRADARVIDGPRRNRGDAELPAGRRRRRCRSPTSTSSTPSRCI